MPNMGLTKRAVKDYVRAPVLDRDVVYDAALDSFPASDAPSWGHCASVPRPRRPQAREGPTCRRAQCDFTPSTGGSHARHSRIHTLAPVPGPRGAARHAWRVPTPSPGWRIWARRHAASSPRTRAHHRARAGAPVVRLAAQQCTCRMVRAGSKLTRVIPRCMWWPTPCARIATGHRVRPRRRGADGRGPHCRASSSAGTGTVGTTAAVMLPKPSRSIPPCAHAHITTRWVPAARDASMMPRAASEVTVAARTRTRGMTNETRRTNKRASERPRVAPRDTPGS
jgi:hypothetical protein